MDFFSKLKQSVKHFVARIDNPLVTSGYNALARCKRKQQDKTWIRRVRKGQSNFVSIETLMLWTSEWMQTVALDYDIIIGVPRCGLLVASIIAAKGGKALASTDTVSRGELWNSRRAISLDCAKRVLLVDDSLGTGKTIQRHQQAIKARYPHLEVDTASMIVHRENYHMVDYYYKIIPTPLILEWEIMDEAKVDILAVNMEGVLCQPYQDSPGRNEEEYLRWVKGAKPYMIPSYHFDAVLSDRSERYRAESEEWLRIHNVQYRELRFSDLIGPGVDQGVPNQQKIEHLNELKPQMFFEYSMTSAQAIWDLTKIPTLSFEAMVLFPIK